MSEEKLEFSRSLLIYGNLALLAWMLLSFLSVWLYNDVYGYLLLLFDAFIIYVILRRLGCSSCYMCRACTSGFGRLAGDFFGRGFIKKESVGNRIGAVAFMYVLLLPVPAAFLVLSGFRVASVFVLVCLLAVSVYSLLTWYNRKLPKKV